MKITNNFTININYINVTVHEKPKIILNLKRTKKEFQSKTLFIKIVKKLKDLSPLRYIIYT